MSTVSPFARERQACLLPAGQRNIIVGFKREDLAGKLLAMGILPGSTLEVVRRSPFGGACYVRVDDQAIALRDEELAAILIAE